ncbi:MAG TPA: SpoIID/LytB domain-containing protein [Pyrinomonadaceae bacterium]|nr:SpoIID/LytB domain-containing protein [Pyrinomonadaceae bacterium]
MEPVTTSLNIPIKRFSLRITPTVFLTIFLGAVVIGVFLHLPASRSAPGASSVQGGGKLKIVVRDSATGSPLAAEVVSQVEDRGLSESPALVGGSRAETLRTNAKGEGEYQLSSGKNELEIHAVNHKSLRTHFQPDAQAVKTVTFWVDPITPPDELRAEVIAAKTRAGQALLHGHVFDVVSGLPIKGARIQLQRAGVKSRTDARGYFVMYAPVSLTNPAEELPGSDNLIVSVSGFKTYRRANVTLVEGTTHFIIDLSPGSGVTKQDDTHKLKLRPEQLSHTQTERPEDRDQMSDVGDQPLGASRQDGLPRAPESLKAGEAVSQPPTVVVPTSIRVGSNCPSGRASCTTFNVYSLDSYVGTGLDDEWFSSWNVESLKAGAIAYRSYAVWFVYHPISANYDICNTTSCQAHDPTDSSSRTIAATNNTAGMIVTDSSGSNSFFAEYAAENNNNACADGFTGSPSANWPCLSDPVDAGQTFNGHGRGMCQWGTQRWATNQAKDYVWIVNHYYNNNGSPSGARSGVLQTPATPTPTPTPTPSPSPSPSPMQLMLEAFGSPFDQVAGLDSVLFIRDPLPVVNAADLLNTGSDKNTRVIVFVTNLQLDAGELSSAVVVNLVDANSQSYDVPAEDVRTVPGMNFTQVIFRLPNNLPAGTCTIKIHAHSQVSNAGTIRIRD